MDYNHKIREDLDRLLIRDDYMPSSALDVLKRVPIVEQSLRRRNSRKRDYSLYDHTLMVCVLFERHFSHRRLPLAYSRSAFRLMLCLHDIGKPRALEEDQKELQHQYTLEIWSEISNCLPLSQREWRTNTGMLSDDPLGLYIRRKIALEECSYRINKMAHFAGERNIIGFLDLLTVYYQVDAGAYTRDAFILESDTFIEKPKLEAVFQKTETGALNYSPEKGRLEFSPRIESIYQSLRDHVLSSIV